MSESEGKVAIITGASSGIGEALARELHRRGWRVGLVARRVEALEALAASLGAGAAAAGADVTDAGALSAAIVSLEDRLGTCDLIVCNAGIGYTAKATRFEREKAVAVLRVNVEGALNGVAAVLPGMLARRQGHLAVVSSLAGARGMPGSGSYSASKAAVTALFESWRLELRPKGIAVTTIHPGFIKTPMTDLNRFPMPFLMPVERAARIVADGLERRKSEVNLPWQMAWATKVLRLLPNAVYDWLLRRVSPV